MTHTLRIAARHALSAGLATSAWRKQGSSKLSQPMQSAARNGKYQPCAYAGFGNAPRHEIDSTVYREIAM